MPQRWLHETHDLIVFGRSYWRQHKDKDAPSQTLGPCHRIKNHDWYQRFGVDWDFETPFPACAVDKNLRLLRSDGRADAERFQADLAHDHLDRCWDELSPLEWKGWAAAFRALILAPDSLKRLADIDILQGKIKVTHRNGFVVWEDQPNLKRDWSRLKTYVEALTVDELV